MKLRIRKVSNGFAMYGKDFNGKNVRLASIWNTKEEAYRDREDIIRKNQSYHLAVDMLNDHRVYMDFLREKGLLIEFRVQVRDQISSMSTKDIIKELNKRRKE